MEIKLKRSDMLKGLGLVQGIVERKTTMPILANVLLKAEGKNVFITATDLEVGMKVSLPSEVVSNGEVTVHARSIYDIVRELPDELVHIKVEDSNWVNIICGKSNFRVVGLSPEEFPALPDRDGGESQQIDCAVIKGMVEKTSFAMSTDETRYNLNGVYFERFDSEKGTGLKMVATDGHRLSIVDRVIEQKWSFPGGVIIPRKGVGEIKKLVDSGDSPVELWVGKKYLIAHRDDVSLYVRLVDGKFPPYDQVVPKNPKRIVSIDRKNLVHALRRVSVLSTDRTRGVKFFISPKNVDIHASNPDIGEASEELAANYKGDSFEIGFNAKYFLDALNTIGDEQAVLGMGDETAPCVLKSEFDKGFTHVIMPMRL
jgi:DNA polymerase III subunit beta